MILKEIAVKGIVTKSNLPGCDYVVNPYVGCQHGCIYCYAEFMRRFTGHRERWGTFLDVKANAAETVGDTARLQGKSILLSSVTDAYQPVEATYRLTRRILEALAPGQPAVEVLTKSRLVTRDIGILRRFDDATVGVSLSTLDHALSRELEPGASPPGMRLTALRECHDAGLRTFAFLSPILPGITEVREIIETAAPHADFLMFENLNVRPHNEGRVFSFVERSRPTLLGLYKRIYLGKENAYWRALAEDIRKWCASAGKEADIGFHEGGFKKEPKKRIAE